MTTMQKWGLALAAVAAIGALSGCQSTESPMQAPSSTPPGTVAPTVPTKDPGEIIDQMFAPSMDQELPPEIPPPGDTTVTGVGTGGIGVIA